MVLLLEKKRKKRERKKKRKQGAELQECAGQTVCNTYLLSKIKLWGKGTNYGRGKGVVVLCPHVAVISLRTLV
jgi:hypothetical protein